MPGTFSSSGCLSQDFSVFLPGHLHHGLTFFFISRSFLCLLLAGTVFLLIGTVLLAGTVFLQTGTVLLLAGTVLLVTGTVFLLTGTAFLLTGTVFLLEVLPTGIHLLQDKIMLYLFRREDADCRG